MNYLAHLFLSEASPESRIGNLLGDFVKGNLDRYSNYYDRKIIQGIKTHRQVDSFTDNHAIYIQSKRRVSASNRRLAGIIIDICYDYFLAKYWDIFSQEKLDTFVRIIYANLQENQQILPTKLQQALPRMIGENWLGCYQTLTGVDLTFSRIARRLKRENNLANAVNELIDNYTGIEADFLLFFPEVINYVEKNRQYW